MSPSHHRRFMAAVRISVTFAFCALLCAPAYAQDWAPSPFGETDQSGASILMTESKAIEAANLIRRGRVVPLGRPYSANMPLGAEGAFSLSNTNTPARVVNGAVLMEGQLTARIGQIGTQLNGLGHIGLGAETPLFYNGTPLDDLVGDTGLSRLGIEHVKPFFTRGIMIDMVTLRGGPMEAGDEITVANIETALDWQELSEPRAGDVVIFHTGWGRHWLSDPETYLSGAPGIGMEAAAWLIERRVTLVGADTWSVEVQPSGDPESALPVHAEMIAKNGIFLHENLETERLVDAEISEFAFIFAPLPIIGATGSPGEPLAVY